MKLRLANFDWDWRQWTWGLGLDWCQTSYKSDPKIISESFVNPAPEKQRIKHNVDIIFSN